MVAPPPARSSVAGSAAGAVHRRPAQRAPDGPPTRPSRSRTRPTSTARRSRAAMPGGGGAHRRCRRSAAAPRAAAARVGRHAGRRAGRSRGGLRARRGTGTGSPGQVGGGGDDGREGGSGVLRAVEGERVRGAPHAAPSAASALSTSALPPLPERPPTGAVEARRRAGAAVGLVIKRGPGRPARRRRRRPARADRRRLG